MEMEAVNLYKKACDRNGSLACLSLGVLYINGEGVPKSLKQAEVVMRKSAKLFKAECEKGIELSCDYYNKVYDLGFGVEE